MFWAYSDLDSWSRRNQAILDDVDGQRLPDSFLADVDLIRSINRVVIQPVLLDVGVPRIDGVCYRLPDGIHATSEHHDGQYEDCDRQTPGGVIRLHRFLSPGSSGFVDARELLAIKMSLSRVGSMFCKLLLGGIS